MTLNIGVKDRVKAALGKLTHLDIKTHCFLAISGICHNKGGME